MNYRRQVVGQGAQNNIQVLGNSGHQGMNGNNSNNSLSSGEGERVIQKIREELLKRGNRAIRAIGKTFRTIDSYDGNRKLDSQEFIVGLRENGITITQQEVHLVFHNLDRDGNGFIDYDEFLYSIRGKPNRIRQDIIDKSFHLMDKDKQGSIDKNDLMGIYDVTKHPKYNNGRSQAQIIDEFLENFGDNNRDNKITKREWDDYYAAVSVSVDNDEHFVLLMERAWKMKK